MERRSQATGIEGRGGSWDVVFPGEAISQELALGPEQSRRDESLNYRDSGAAVVIADWPDADRPSLDDARRLFLGHRADEVLYFSAPVYRRPGGAYRWR